MPTMTASSTQRGPHPRAPDPDSAALSGGSREPLDCRLRSGSDLGPALATVGDRVEDQGRPDPEADLPEAGPPGMRRPGLEGTGEVAGDHRHRSAGHQHPQARLEGSHLAVAAPGPLREE